MDMDMDMDMDTGMGTGIHMGMHMGMHMGVSRGVRRDQGVAMGMRWSSMGRWRNIMEMSTVFHLFMTLFPGRNPHSYLFSIASQAGVEARGSHEAGKGDTASQQQQQQQQQVTASELPHSPNVASSEFSKMIVLLFGLSFHSFFVGLALGVGGGEVGLFIAIVAHQFFEGMALGGRILKSQLAKGKEQRDQTGRKRWFYDLVFAFSCPVGIAVGIAIYYSPLLSQQTYSIVNSVFQGLSAGILIYVSLVHVVSGGHHDSPHTNAQHATQSKMSTYFGLAAGVAIMSIIGIWA